MKSEPTRRPRVPAMTLIALIVIACGARQTHVDCSPTPSCSLDDKRFAPPPKVDAGAPKCGVRDKRCRAVEIAAGGSHTCTRTGRGEVLCWGDDADDQLGPVDPELDAGKGMHAPPVLGDAAQISAGGAHNCARTHAGAVLCWGRDAEGQVDGHARAQSVPMPMSVAIDRASDVDAGAAHTCAVVARGVVCWGDARYGQSGRELRAGTLAPGLVPGTAGAVEVTAGSRHSCARLESGRVLCWGELIDASGHAHASASVSQVQGLDDAIEIDAGAGHTCAVRVSGAVACWGGNAAGQLGDGTTSSRATPVEVAGLPHALHVSAGGAEHAGELVGHTCALDSGLFVLCWGHNTEGELDVGPAKDSARPLPAQGLPGESDEPYLGDMIGITAGGMHGCALDHDGLVLCWGDDSQGQLATDKPPPFGRAIVVKRFSD